MINMYDAGEDKYFNIKNKLSENRAEIDCVQMYISDGRLKSNLCMPGWDDGIEPK